MRIPESLSSLVDEGIIEEVVRPLMSGKEAQIYLVVAGGKQQVAKIYKDAQNRSFKHRADYTEGRKVRNSRDQRAIDKRSKHGRSRDEAAWRSTEVDMIYRLQAAGVRVPVPYQFIDGVLIMELVCGPEGEPAPRLGDVQLQPEEALVIYQRLVGEVVRMLCAGVVHGDLSDFNVLLGSDGPVIIDLPQAVDPSKNPSARRLLVRDVDNLHRFITRFVPEQQRMPYAEEMWALYESNQLTPETRLRGHYAAPKERADTRAVLEAIGEARADARARGLRTDGGSAEAGAAGGGGTGGAGARPRRVEVVVDKHLLHGKKARMPDRGARPGAARPPAPAGQRRHPGAPESRGPAPAALGGNPGRERRPALHPPGPHPSVHAAPRFASQRPSEPRQSEPRLSEPRLAEPRPAGQPQAQGRASRPAHPAGPHPSVPRAPGQSAAPRPAAPQASGPRVSVPHASGQHPSGQVRANAPAQHGAAQGGGVGSRPAEAGQSASSRRRRRRKARPAAGGTSGGSGSLNGHGGEARAARDGSAGHGSGALNGHGGEARAARDGSAGHGSGARPFDGARRAKVSEPGS